jgi:hypothetical protein
MMKNVDSEIFKDWLKENTVFSWIELSRHQKFINYKNETTDSIRTKKNTIFIKSSSTKNVCSLNQLLLWRLNQH